MFVRNLASPEPPVQPGGKPVESPLWYRDRTRAGGYSRAKAERVLGWVPQVSLDEGMARTEAWLRTEGYLD